MITSVENKIFKKLKKLLTKKYRDELKEFIVFGEHLIYEAKKNNAIIEIYTTDNEQEGTFIDYNLAKTLSQTKTVFKRFALCKAINKNIISSKVLILDEIQDPQNLGALIRSALAFGFYKIIASKNTCDLYNDKVIRASQGAFFEVDFIRDDLILQIEKLKKENYLVLYADAYDQNIEKKDQQKEKVAIVLGNEGNGVSKAIKTTCDAPIHLKTANVDSLNVSVAGSILMYLYRGD